MVLRIFTLYFFTFCYAQALHLESRVDLQTIKKVADNIDAATLAVFESNDFELPEITDDSVYLRGLLQV